MNNRTGFTFYVNLYSWKLPLSISVNCWEHDREIGIGILCFSFYYAWGG